jgi:proteasome lid subunit RPN8/RPN11
MCVKNLLILLVLCFSAVVAKAQLHFERTVLGSSTKINLTAKTSNENSRVEGNGFVLDFSSSSETPSFSIQVESQNIPIDAELIFKEDLSSFPSFLKPNKSKWRTSGGKTKIQFEVTGDGNGLVSLGFVTIGSDGGEDGGQEPLKFSVRIKLKKEETAAPIVISEPTVISNESGANNGASAASSKTEKVTQKPADELAWELAQKENTLIGYNNFIEKNENSPLVAKAKEWIKRHSKMDYAPKEEADGTLLFQLSNAFNPVQDSLQAGDAAYNLAKLVSSNNATGQFVFALASGSTKAGHIAFFDKDKSKEFQSLRIAIENFFIPKLAEGNLDSVRVFLKGGQPPFKVMLRSEGRFYGESILSTAQNVWDKKSFFQLFPNAPQDRNYEIIVSDVAENPIPIGEIFYPKTPFPWHFLLIIPVILILAAIQYLKKQKRKNELATLLEKRKSEDKDFLTTGKSTVSEPVEVVENPSIETKKVEKTPVETPAFANTSGIKMQRKANTAEWSDETRIVNVEDYAAFSIAKLWADTAVPELLFHKKAARALDDFIKSQGTIMEEAEGSIPEIGGLLMGDYEALGGGRYRVRVEEFLPINPEFHNVYKLEFSTTSLVRELGHAQDVFPHLMLMGWFHTHPGHGLFLSKPDMTIQDGFFLKPWQFAMEIDNTTPNLDTAFFTRKTSGVQNNKEDRKDFNFWFSWVRTMYSFK